MRFTLLMLHRDIYLRLIKHPTCVTNFRELLALYGKSYLRLYFTCVRYTYVALYLWFKGFYLRFSENLTCVAVYLRFSYSRHPTYVAFVLVGRTCVLCTSTRDKYEKNTSRPSVPCDGATHYTKKWSQQNRLIWCLKSGQEN